MSEARNTEAATTREWRRIDGGEGTGCALGTPYRFFYRPGDDASRLLVYFQGGGACWSWVSCSGMFDTSVEDAELADYRGIFDPTNDSNPFRRHALLFVPYCTGDVHVGDAEVRYGDDAGTPPVAHRGASNAAAALRWVENELDAPKEVVVAGASAGSYGAIFHTPRVAKLYPDAELIVIGDSGVPLLKDYPQILEQWGAGSFLRPLWRAGDEVPLTLERAYRVAASLPRVRTVAVITSDRDAIQGAFYLISGSPAWREDTYALLDRLEHELDAFRSFVVAGADHGLLRTDAFYDYHARGTALATWIDRLLAGEPVESIRCAGCSPR